MGLLRLVKMLWSFSGRWGRWSFLQRSFFHPILVIAPVAIAAALLEIQVVDINKLIMNVVAALFFLVHVPILVRRYHDFGKSAWWVVGALSACALFVGVHAFLVNQGVQSYFEHLVLAILFFLYLAAFTVKGDVGQNQFGSSLSSSLPRRENK